MDILIIGKEASTTKQKTVFIRGIHDNPRLRKKLKIPNKKSELTPDQTQGTTREYESKISRHNWKDHWGSI